MGGTYSLLIDVEVVPAYMLIKIISILLIEKRDSGRVVFVAHKDIQKQTTSNNRRNVSVRRTVGKIGDQESSVGFADETTSFLIVVAVDLGLILLAASQEGWGVGTWGLILILLVSLSPLSSGVTLGDGRTTDVVIVAG